jgi:hypothetical protein
MTQSGAYARAIVSEVEMAQLVEYLVEDGIVTPTWISDGPDARTG